MDSEDGPRPGAPPAALVPAIRRLLRPLVRVLIANGLTYPSLAELLKGLYVEVAERRFPVEGKPQTDSRITLLTGIHRKDVRRLRGAAAGRQAPSPAISLNAQLIGVWLGKADYEDAAGRPRPLPRHATPDERVSFDGLVESVSKDIRPRAVLDEWLRQGIARIDDDDRVVLDAEAFVPREDFADLAYYFGRNLHDHIAAAGHNLSGARPPFLERSVHYDRLTVESAAALAALAGEAGMEALRAVNREALARAERDEDDPAATLRINFGLYTFVEDEADEDSGPSDTEA